MLHILAIIGIVVLTILFAPVMIPALVIAWVTPLSLWPTAAVILAVYCVVGVIKS